MNVPILSGWNSTIEAHALPLSAVTDEPMFRQFRPAVKELIPLPKAVLYLLMAALVVVGVAYAIIGHLIKDLAIDIAECMLGPAVAEDVDKDTGPRRLPFGAPPPLHPFAHNAFHVWDQDVVIPLPPEETPQNSPLLLAALPYFPSFFPLPHSPPSHDNSPANADSPRTPLTRQVGLPGEV